MNYRFNLPNESLRISLHDAIKAKDAQEIAHVLSAQHKEIAASSPDHRPKRRIATDPDMICLPSEDEDLKRFYPDWDNQPDLKPLQDQVEELVVLAKVRDIPLTEVAKMPGIDPALFNVSYFLKDQAVNSYAPKVNFGETIGQVEHIYAGYHGPTNGFRKFGESKRIKTGRDFCALVHTDHPLTEVRSVINQLDALRVEKRVGSDQIDQTPGIDRFASCGWLWMEGLFGKIQRRISWFSFGAHKWIDGIGRPIQLAIDNGWEIFPSAYPELHPSHPSRNAMHYLIYRAFASALKFVYNRHFILPGGNSVGFEVDLWADNFGHGRKWPGVHIDQDHEPYKPLAEALGLKVAQQCLGLKVSIPEAIAPKNTLQTAMGQAQNKLAEARAKQAKALELKVDAA